MQTDPLLKAVYYYVLEYAKPQMAKANIYLAYQNRTALPQGAQDFALLRRGVQPKRIGTNTGELSVSAEGTAVIASLRRYPIDLDFCHVEGSIAAERAECIETLGRSAYSVDFFREYGLCFLHSDDIQYLPYVDEAKQYMHRYRVTLHLSKWNEVAVKQDYFDKARLNRFENIDKHHVPN